MADNQLNIVVNAVDNASESLKQIGEESESSFSGIGIAVAAAGAAVVAFVAESVAQFGELGEQMGKMSDATGISTENLSGLNVAAKENGASLDDVATGVKFMQKNLEAVGGPSKATTEALGALHLKLSDLKAQSPEQQFLTIGSALQTIKDPGEKAALTMATMGRSGLNLSEMFKNAGTSIDALNDKASALGVMFGEDMTEKAYQYNKAMADLSLAFQGIAVEVGSAVAPAITALVTGAIPLMRAAIVDVTKYLVEFWNWLNQTGIIALFDTALKLLWTTFQDKMLPALQKLWVSLQPLMPIFKALAELLGAAFVAAVTVAYGAILLIIDVLSAWMTQMAKNITDLENFGKSVEDVFNSIWSTVQSVISQIEGVVNSAISGWNNLMKTVSAPLGAVGGAVASVGKFLTGKASGGPVDGGTPYIIGEQGPELFIPSSSGSIAPAGSFGGSSIGNINVVVNTGNVNSQIDVRDLGNTVGDALMLRLKAQLKF